MLRRILSWPLVAVFFTTVFTLEASSLKIRVSDGAQLLENCAVEWIEPRASKQQPGTHGALYGEKRTDAQGMAIVELAAGVYSVSVECRQYAKDTKQVSVSDASVNEVEFQLNRQALSEELVVTATRNEIDVLDTPETISVLNQEEIARKNASSVGELFREITGMSVLESGAFRMRPVIRGLDSNRILILVDGERLNNSRTSSGNAGVEVSLVDLNQVRAIEVVRGAGSVLYGTDALAGTINILTTDPSSEGWNGGVSGHYVSSSEGMNGSAFLSFDEGPAFFRISQTFEDYGNYHSGDPDAEHDSEVLNSGFQARNTTLKAGFKLNEQNQLRAEFTQRDGDDVGVPGLSGEFTGYFPFDDRRKFSFAYEGTNLNQTLSRFIVRTYYQLQDRNFTNILDIPEAPPFFPGLFQFSETITRTHTAGADLQATMMLTAKHLLTAGSSIFRDHNRDSRVLAFDRGIFERLNDDYRDAVSQPSLPDASFLNAALFAQDEYQATEKIKIVAGLRYDYFDLSSDPTANFTIPEVPGLELNNGVFSKSDSSISGNLGALFQLRTGIHLNARIGRSFRQPNLFETYFSGPGSVGGFIVPNPELHPESGINFDAGIKYRTSRLEGSITYFRNSYTDFISTDFLRDANGNIVVINPSGQRPVEVQQNINIARALIQGFEWDLAAQWNAGQWGISPFISISYLRGDNSAEDEPLNFISPLKTVAGVRLQSPRGIWFDYTLRNQMEQSRLSDAFLDSNEGPEPGFTIQNIHGGYTWMGRQMNIGITAGLENLTGRFYAEQFVFAPSQGRTFTISTGIDF